MYLNMIDKRDQAIVLNALWKYEAEAKDMDHKTRARCLANRAWQADETCVRREEGLRFLVGVAIVCAFCVGALALMWLVATVPAWIASI